MTLTDNLNDRIENRETFQFKGRTLPQHYFSIVLSIVISILLIIFVPRPINFYIGFGLPVLILLTEGGKILWDKSKTLTINPDFIDWNPGQKIFIENIENIEYYRHTKTENGWMTLDDIEGRFHLKSGDIQIGGLRMWEIPDVKNPDGIIRKIIESYVAMSRL